jgi:hypothetical protein
MTHSLQEPGDCYPRCAACGSTRVKLIEGESGTGVFAPDGYEERRWWEGVRCLDCGAVEEI